ncbi:MAG: peptide chain release factor N(5)-glutamine methyltransferase [Prevotella sp.]|jgi:release factor glutamine methyltransferase|nr:peptide chain release factor N(5)-glutamine methyltransferase [Prevotella sp.]MCI1282575.1 peptide chain release factor N(5)-glutamine methyltransferase [Prevotella sp.]
MTYNELWHLLTPLYDEGEAKAIIRTVMEVVFGLSFTDLYTGKVNEISSEEKTLLEEIIKRLQKGEPVQYVLGQASFCGRTFKVKAGVLIPRPETELLCQWITADYNLPYCGLQPPEPLQVLDIGTGSGCIAVTLALDLWNSAVSAWDISADALLLARDNAHRLGAKVDFRWQDALHPEGTEKWDIIVSNPPYICEKEKAKMAKNVLDYEPEIALFVPDDDPLRFYRSIALYAQKALKPMGRLYFEINPLYAEELKMMLENLHYRMVEGRKSQFGNLQMMKGVHA